MTREDTASHAREVNDSLFRLAPPAPLGAPVFMARWHRLEFLGASEVVAAAAGPGEATGEAGTWPRLRIPCMAWLLLVVSHALHEVAAVAAMPNLTMRIFMRREEMAAVDLLRFAAGVGEGPFKEGFA